MTRLAALPVPIPAVIPVIAVVPTNVPAALNTTLVLMPARRNAGQAVITAKTALPEALHTPALMPELPSAAVAITVMTPVLTVLNLFPALQTT